jgi:RHS repeat-associated protein
MAVDAVYRFLPPGQALSIPLDEYQACKHERQRLAGEKCYVTRADVYGSERTVVLSYNPALFQGQLQGIMNNLDKTLKVLGLLKAKLAARKGAKQRGNKPTLASVEKQVKKILCREHMQTLIDYKIEEFMGECVDLQFSVDEQAFADPNNNQTNFTYDSADRLISQTQSPGGAITYTYNNRGLLYTMTNGRGQVTAYQYDNAGRLSSLTDPAGTVSYTYDQNGNVLTVSSAVYGAITRTYDALNRVTSYTDSQGDTIQYAYDQAGNLITLTYPGGREARYGYDAANRLTGVTDWAGRVTAYQYDQDNRLTKTTRPDGSVLTQSYDPAGQLLEQKDVEAKGNVIDQYDYTYDSDGNVKTEQNAAAAQPFSQANTACAYTNDNRIAAYNGQTVSYDADGNMTTGPLNGTMSAFTYDARNRLTGAGTTTYLYDAENNRIGVTDSVYGTNDSYVINPQAVLSQTLIKTDAQGNKTYYVYGLGLIGQEDSSGNYLTYHFDCRGSTVALTDSNGNVTDTFQYGPYGELVNRTGTDATPFLYCGQYGVMTDTDGLYYMQARYYDTSIRRFINQDVLLGNIDTAQTLNRYQYGFSNPICFIDPKGNFGIGLQLGEQTDIGAIWAGAGQDASLSGGVFTNGSNVSVGSTVSYGSMVGGPGYGSGYPSTSNNHAIFGGGISGGVSAFVTNAGDATDLSGPFHTASLDVAWLYRGFSAQLSWSSNGFWDFSTNGVVLPGAGVSATVSYYDTNTQILYDSSQMANQYTSAQDNK